MKTIDLSKIIILPDRQRKEFDSDSLLELSDSLKVNGIIQPITLRSEAEPTLVAGERRIRAAKMLYGRKHKLTFEGKQLPPNHIPYLEVGGGNDIKYEEIELVENIHRTDLTWQEKASAIQRIHEMKQEVNPRQTQQETAALINDTRSAVQENMILARHMHDPEVAKAPTKKAAMKIIRKKSYDKSLDILSSVGEKPTTLSHHNHIHMGDCVEVMKSYEAEVFDCILTDPPYGIGADKFKEQVAGTHAYDDSQAYFQRLIQDCAFQWYRVAKPMAHLYVFHDIRSFPYIKGQLETAGFYVWPRPMIWAKGNGMAPQPDYGPRNSYEAIIFATKGRRKVTTTQNDVLMIPAVQNPRHAAEKPVALYVELLKRSCHPGDVVLDSFAGSGPIFPAANMLNLKAHGINLDQADYNLAKSRMSEGL